MGQWAIFLAVSRKIVAGVVRIAMFAPVGTFWRKKFSKTWFFPQRFLDIEWKLDGFSRQIYSGIIKIAFYVSMGTIWEKKVLKEENFRQNFSFSTNWRKKLAGLPKSVPYVSIGDISRKTIFPEWKNFFIPQTLLGLFSSFFRLPGQKRILRAHRDILRKKFLSRKNYSSIISEYWAKNFWAILLQKLGGGGQNINLPYINILKKKHFLGRKEVFVYLLTSSKKIGFLLNTFRPICPIWFLRVRRNSVRKSDFLSFSEKTFDGVVQTALNASRGTNWGRTFFWKKSFFYINFGQWAILLGIYLKLSIGVVRTEFYVSIGSFSWIKKFLKERSFFYSFWETGWKFLNFSRQIYSAIIKTAFYLLIRTISEKKQFWKKTFSKTFNSLSKKIQQCCQNCV